MHKYRNTLLIGALVVITAISVISCAPISPAPARDSALESVDATTEADPESQQLESNGTAFLPPENPPSRLIRSMWATDFSKRTVEWDEIMSGGPPKDGIPAVDNPVIESVQDSAKWLTDRDPVIVYEHNGAARAYPLAILIWHEIVNDEVAGQPVSVTFCPLCNASIVFDRNFKGKILDFGTTGLLRNSDLIMFDRQTETWWQQFVGQGIAGQYTGEQLTFLPSQVVSFEDFRAKHPNGTVLARPDAPRSYGSNPYTNYDSTTGRPFLYSGELDTRLDSTERIVGVERDGHVMAYPFSILADVKVINDEIGALPITIFHKSGTASALDTSTINEGRDVGSTAVFNRILGDQTLTFEPADNGTFRDVETGSIWNIFGEAIEGELEGEALEQILSFDHFWFAWTAFYPQTGLHKG